jgi:hypothetical protein
MTDRYLKEVDDPFWSEMPSVLVNKDRLIEFIPAATMTWKERLNALTRLGFYISIVLMMYLGKSWPLYIALSGLIFTLVLFRYGPQPRPIHTAPIEQDEHPTFRSPNPFIPEDQPICTPPTRDNPFMNVLQNEYIDNPTRPPACEYEEVKDQVEKDWAYNLYQDVGDAVFNRSNSQRQWYTNPSTTIPNDQGGFAAWLYLTGPTCKSGGDCYRYEDLRANRPTFGNFENLG